MTAELIGSTNKYRVKVKEKDCVLSFNDGIFDESNSSFPYISGFDREMWEIIQELMGIIKSIESQEWKKNILPTLI